MRFHVPGSLGQGDARVLRRAVHRAVDRERMQPGACLGAEELDVHLVGLVAGKVALHLQAAAVLEPDDAAPVIIGGVLPGVVAGRSHVLPVALSQRAELRPGNPEDAHGSRHAHQPPGRVQVVHAHVAEGPAAGLDEPQVPVGNAAAAHAAGAGVVDRPERVLPAEGAQVAHLVGEARGERHHVHHAGLLRLRHQRGGRARRVGKRLGDHDMLAAPHRFERDGNVQLVGRAHEDRVDLGVGAELLVVGEQPHRRGQLFRERLHAVLEEIAERDHPCPGIRRQGPAVLLADSHPHDSDSNLFHLLTPVSCRGPPPRCSRPPS